MRSRSDIGAEAVKDSTAIPEKEMAAAVLHLVLLDLEAPHRLNSADEAPDVLKEARLFCFSSDPEWRWSREAWCDVADVDPDFFQRQAILRHAARP